MPSPIGHALAGVATAWSGGGDAARSRRLTWTCALLGAAADLDLLAPYPHRAYTHSIGAVLLIMIVVAGVTRWVTPGRARRWTLVCSVAYASHLALDWMAADTSWPYGIRALWPFSDGWYISGWDVFEETARRHMFARAVLLQNARAVAREIAILGPLAAAVGVTRFLLRGARGPSGSAAPPGAQA